MKPSPNENTADPRQGGRGMEELDKEIKELEKTLDETAGDAHSEAEGTLGYLRKAK
jgi:hypothetical protein